MTASTRDTVKSDFPWLGAIPSHWDVKALKFCAELVTERVDGSSVNAGTYVGLEHIESKTGRIVRAEGSQDSADSTVSCFHAGDVLFGKLRPYLAKAAVAEAAGVCSSEILVYRPHGLTPEYMKYVMLLEGFIEEVNSSTYGSKMPRADASFISRLPVPQPSIEEQIAVASYLDAETKRIDGLIAEKKKLIGALDEMKQVVTTEAITTGVGSDASHAPGDLLWFSTVPRTWRVKRLKFLLSGIEQGWSPQAESRQADEGEWGVLKAGACNGGEFRADEQKALPPGIAPDVSLEVREGDVLMSRGSGSADLVGSVALVGPVRRFLMLSDLLYRLTIHDSDEINPRWLVLALGSSPLRRQIRLSLRGAEGLTRKVTTSDIKELVLPVPPRVEQDAIVEQVLAEWHRLAELRQHATKEVDLLLELRAATITDAVLGRIDVRPT